MFSRQGISMAFVSGQQADLSSLHPWRGVLLVVEQHWKKRSSVSLEFGQWQKRVCVEEVLDCYQ